MKMVIFLLFHLAFLFGSCEEEFSIIQSNLPELSIDSLSVIWKIPLFSDTSECTPGDPIFFDKKINIYASHLTLGDNTLFRSLDAETGEVLWVWENDIVNGGEVLLTINHVSYLYSNYYAVSAGGDIMTIDMNVGNTVWSTSLEQALVQLSGYENVIFHCRTSGGVGPENVYLMYTNIEYENWDTIITFNETAASGYSPSIPTVSANINIYGDTLLYFQNRQWNFSESDGKIDLYCYNMTADSIVWVNYDIDAVGNSAILAPMYYDGKIYFRGSWVLYCFDAVTGAKLWDKTFGGDAFEDLLFGNNLVIDGKLIVKTSGSTIYALDPMSGAEIWKNSDAGQHPSYMTYYNGNVYYGASDGKIHVISVATGKTVKAFHSPGYGHYSTPNAYFQDCVAIDPENKYLYAADGYYLYCIKIEW